MGHGQVFTPIRVGMIRIQLTNDVRCRNTLLGLIEFNL